MEAFLPGPARRAGRPPLRLAQGKLSAAGTAALRLQVQADSEMENVPKSVLRRLQGSTAGAHPDANLLTAFAEQALPESERALITVHLADCGDCRDVVALALPETEVASATAVRGIGRGWSSLPVLRWGVVVAGVVVLTSIGVHEYRLAKPRESRLAALQTENQPALPTAKSITPAAVPEAQPRTPREQTELIMDKKVPRQAPAFADSERAQPRARQRMATDAVAGARAGISAAGASESAKFAATAPTLNSAGPTPGKAAPAAAPAVPRASEVVEVEAQSGTVNTGAVNTETAQTSIQIAQNQSTLPMNGRNVMKLDVVKAKDPVAAKGAPGAVAGSSSAVPQTQSTLKTDAFPRWSVSSGGSLQRSFDAGKTWEDVSVTGPLGAAGAMVVSVEGNGGYKKEAEADQGKAEKVEAKKLEKAPANPLFRAVSASGAEVWAGGAGALLYHSTDMGAHWTRVIPSTASAVVTGDITGIQFADAQHGRVATSTGEVWITSDSGQSWQKQ